MTDWIAKHFIKDYENVSDPKVRTAYGQVSGIIGILTNLLLVAGKLTVGLIAGSISIIGDALNNLADAGSSIVTLVGFRLSSKPADNEHPYGHARIEYVTGLIISMSVVFIGLQLGMESFDKIIPGFTDEQAVVAGIESRTSSPVRITRDEEFQAIGIKGLYPCGEGAGYAGGIVSSAVDGIRQAENVIHHM